MRRAGRSWWPRLGVAAAVLLIVVLAAAVAWSWPWPAPASPALGPSQLLVAVLDVGQADAIVVRAPSGRTMLIDAGNDTADARNVVLPYLRSLGVKRLDYAVLTHPDQDHVGGLPTVLESLPVGTFVDSVQPGGRAYERTLEIVRDRGVTPVRARAGRPAVDLGPEVQVQVLGPPEPLLTAGDADRNNNSVVLRLVYNRFGVVLPGDLSQEGEAAVLASHPDLRIQVLKVGHHGSSSSTTARFLAALSPEVAIISVGRGNSYGHPHRETIAALTKSGAAIYRTDLNGTIEVRSDGVAYQVTTTR